MSIELPNHFVRTFGNLGERIAKGNEVHHQPWGNRRVTIGELLPSSQGRQDSRMELLEAEIKRSLHQGAGEAYRILAIAKQQHRHQRFVASRTSKVRVHHSAMAKRHLCGGIEKLDPPRANTR